MNHLIEIKDIAQRIIVIRGIKVILDRDLSQLYEVELRVLKQAVRRNLKRFPSDFMFELTREASIPNICLLHSLNRAWQWCAVRYGPKKLSAKLTRVEGDTLR